MSTPTLHIDLNADLGETDCGGGLAPDDERMLAIVTSANVACGFHAGDADTMRATCAAAVARGVVIGAHISYRDRAGFGRRFIDVPPTQLVADLREQLANLRVAAEQAGGRVAYVKPHGALYNAIVSHAVHARAVVEACAEFDVRIPILCLPGALVLDLAHQAGLPTAREAFADRAYTASGTLLPRSEPGAVLTDPALAAQRMATLVTQGVIVAADGTRVAIAADSVCVHGDSPGAWAMARAVRARLERAGVTVAPFS